MNMQARHEKHFAKNLKNETGAEVIVRTLVEMGVEVVFGYPGAAVLPIYDLLFDRGRSGTSSFDMNRLPYMQRKVMRAVLVSPVSFLSPQVQA